MIRKFAAAVVFSVSVSLCASVIISLILDEIPLRPRRNRNGTFDPTPSHWGTWNVN